VTARPWPPAPGLGELAVKRFNRTGRSILAVLLVALIVANALNIAADLVAVGSGMQLLHAGPTWLWALLAGALITTLLVLGSFARIALVFKVLCAALLAYLVVAVLVTHQWGSVLSHTDRPPHRVQQGLPGAPGRRARHDHFAVPVLLAERPPPRRDARRTRRRRQAQPLKQQSPKRAKRKQSTSRLDVFGGMTFSNLVMFAIIVATAETLHAHHKTNVQSAAQAAAALKPFAGHFASAIFALGFIGSGLLAIPVLAGSGSVGMAGLLGKSGGSRARSAKPRSSTASSPWARSGAPR
jgi:Mn2+/Fe2+ NRAMP family transporter